MELGIKITGDSRSATAAISGVSRSLTGLEQGLSSVIPGVGGLASSVAALANPAVLAGAALGAAATAAFGMGAALAKSVADTVAFGDGIGDLSAQIGIGAESLQTLQYAAERSGGSADSMRGAVKALTASIAEAQDGGSKAARIFDALGIATTDATGAMRPVEDVLRDTIGALGELGPGTEQAAAASNLLGRAYQDLLPLIKGGADGLAELEGNARSLGGVMSEESVAAASALDDALVDLRFAAGGLWHEIGGALIPTLTEAAEWLLEAGRSGELADAAWSALKVTASGIVSVVPGIGPVLSVVTDRLFDLRGGAEAAGEAVEEFSEDAEGESQDAAGYGRLQARMRSLRGAMADLKDESKATADVVVASSVRLGSTLGQIQIEDEGATARRADEWSSFMDSSGSADVGIDLTQFDDATESQVALRDSTMDTAAAFGTATSAAGDMFATIIDGANTSKDKTLTLTAQLVRLGTQVVSQIATSAAAAISASASTATAQTASNVAIATSAGAAGGAQATATFGASAGAGAAAFIGALASIGGAVASFVAGIADGGVGPDQLRRAGLLRHTVLAVRNDERVLSPRGTSAVDEMLEAWRTGDRVGQGSQRMQVRTSVVLDGREIGYAMDEHLIQSTERGRSWQDRVRQPWQGA